MKRYSKHVKNRYGLSQELARLPEILGFIRNRLTVDDLGLTENDIFNALRPGVLQAAVIKAVAGLWS